MADAFQTQVQLSSGGDAITKPEHLVLSPAMALGQISRLSEVLPSILKVGVGGSRHSGSSL